MLKCLSIYFIGGHYMSILPKIQVLVTPTKRKCAIGEEVSKEAADKAKIPVLSCEGACIKGEIARLAANILSKEDGFMRGCHGELFSMPTSQMAQWIYGSDSVVCIDGCFLKCHYRILENMIKPSKLLSFDALSFHKKFSELFNIDDVPEQTRKEVASSVAVWVLSSIKNNEIPQNDSCDCCN